MQNTVHFRKVQGDTSIVVWLTDDNDQPLGKAISLPCTATRQADFLVFEYPDQVFYPQLAENQDRWEQLAGQIQDTDLLVEDYKKILVDLLSALGYSQDPVKQREPVESALRLAARLER